MKILLYNPDNGVTRNFMPHLWMFLLQAITPPGHEVTLIDANARAMSDDEIVEFIKEQKIELVGIGSVPNLDELSNTLKEIQQTLKPYLPADAVPDLGPSDASADAGAASQEQ